MDTEMAKNLNDLPNKINKDSKGHAEAHEVIHSFLKSLDLTKIVEKDSYEQEVARVNSELSRIESLVPADISSEVDLIKNTLSEARQKIDTLESKPDPTDFTGDISTINGAISSINSKLPNFIDNTGLKNFAVTRDRSVHGRYMIDEYKSNAGGPVADSTAIKNMMDDTLANDGIAVLNPKTYKLTETLVIDTSRTTFDGNGAVFDCTGIPDGSYALRPIGVSNRGTQLNSRGSMRGIYNLQLLGSTDTSRTTDGIFLEDSTTPGHLAHIKFGGLVTYGFRNAITWGAQSWCITFDNPNISAFWNYGFNLVPKTNAGENMRVFGGAVYSGRPGATALYTEGNPDVYFFGTSFDYNTRQAKINGGTVNLIGCHIEDGGMGSPAYDGSPMFEMRYVSGSARSQLSIVGGRIDPTEPNSVTSKRECLIYIPSDAGGTKIDVGIDGGTHLAIWGQDLEVIRDDIGANVNIGTYFLDEGRTGSGDNTSGAARISRRYNRLDDSLDSVTGWKSDVGSLASETATGRRGKNVWKNTLSTAGTGAVMKQDIPVTPASQMVISGFVKCDLTEGSVDVRVRWLDRTGSISNKDGGQSLGTYSVGTSTWRPHSTMRRVPAWASAMRIEIVATAAVGSVRAETWTVN